MGFWRKIEETLWTGPVVKDYGVVAETRWGPGTRRVSVLLSLKSGQRRFFIRTLHLAVLSANVSFLELDRESALKLKVALDDALGQM